MVCKDCHNNAHRIQGWQGGIPLTLYWETVVSIESVGVHTTYDISVEGEFENFVANGLVVHNSRSSASSRAVPVAKMIDRAVNDPVIPLHWGKNQAGMVAEEEFTPEQQALLTEYWLQARDHAVEAAERFNLMGVHKQITNRLLEPFLWHKTIITSTEWDNFFTQRIHPHSQPEMRALAEAIRDALNTSTPERNYVHLPYVTQQEIEEIAIVNTLIKISIARCARVSYLNHDGTYDVNKDINLFQKLYEADPKHLSPFEMVAIDTDDENFYFNIRGWKSMRWFIEKEEYKF